MSESTSIRVYVNGRGVEVDPGSTALDAVRAVDAATAELVVAGTRSLTDSRGLPLTPDSRVFAGAIYRVVSARRRADEDSADA